MKIKDITNCIEEIAPLNYAEDFDNVGLLIGNYNTTITGVLVTLDTLENVVDEEVLKAETPEDNLSDVRQSEEVFNKEYETNFKNNLDFVVFPRFDTSVEE